MLALILCFGGCAPQTIVLDGPIEAQAVAEDFVCTSAFSEPTDGRLVLAVQVCEPTGRCEPWQEWGYSASTLEVHGCEEGDIARVIWGE